jgi:hypothetical protein
MVCVYEYCLDIKCMKKKHYLKEMKIGKSTNMIFDSISKGVSSSLGFFCLLKINILHKKRPVNIVHMNVC